MRMRKRGLTWHVYCQSSVSFIHAICPSASASMFALSTQQHRSVSVVTECFSIDGSQCYVVICNVSFIRDNSLSSLLALWGNKNGLPSMKVKKVGNYLDRMGSTGCKWSSLNVPGTENPPLSPPILELDEFPFPIISPLG